MRVNCYKFSDPRPRNSCRQVECLFSEQWGRWRERSEAGGVQSPRSAGSRRPGTMERLVDESGQLVVDLLLHRKPVQATKNWWDVVASASSRQKARWLQTASVLTHVWIAVYFYHLRSGVVMYPSVCLPVCPSVCLSVRPSACLYACNTDNFLDTGSSFSVRQDTFRDYGSSPYMNVIGSRSKVSAVKFLIPAI